MRNVFSKSARKARRSRVSLAALLAVCCLTLGGCRYSYEISETAYIVACGVDVGENAPYRFTFQFAKPLKIAGGGEEEGGEGEKEDGASSLYSAESDDLFAALNLLNNALSKQVNLSHMKLLVFSARQAERGVTDILQFFMKSAQARPGTFVAVSTASARDYLAAVRPELEASPSKYYTLVFSQKNSNFAPETTLRTMYLHSESDGREAVAPLVTVRKAEDASDGEGEDGTELSGMAVVRGGTLTATHPPADVALYRLCSGQLKPSYFHIPSDGADGEPYVLDLRQRRRPRVRVSIEDGVPTVRLTARLSAQLVASPAGGDGGAIASVAKRYLERETASFLVRTAREDGADLVGFGRLAKRLFRDEDAWRNYGWRDRYPDARFFVTVDLRVTNSGLLDGG